jgi:hypothetical protein
LESVVSSSSQPWASRSEARVEFGRLAEGEFHLVPRDWNWIPSMFVLADDSLQRLAADHGLWAGSYVRGDLPEMKAQAAAFLADVATKPDSGEAGIAHRVQGMTHLFAGEFVEAAHELELALAGFEPGRDDDLAVRFPPDPGTAAMTYLAFATLRLLEEKVVELNIVEKASDNTIGRTLKKRPQTAPQAAMGDPARSQCGLRRRHGRRAGHLPEAARSRSSSRVFGRDLQAN